MLKEALNLDVFSYLIATEYLEKLYSSLKSNRKRYSYQQFSQDLGFQKSSYLFQILSGNRPLTEIAAKTIAESIPLRKGQRKYFLALAKHGRVKSAKDRHEAFRDILEIRTKCLNTDADRQMLQYFSDWYHSVIRELVCLPDFQPEPSWIAQKIQPPIKTEDAAHSFELLKKLDFIKFDKARSCWIQTEVKITSSTDVRKLGLMAYHHDMIQRAQDSLLGVPAQERKIEALTFSVSEKEFLAIKDQLDVFVKKLIASYPQNDQFDRVAQLNIQLFPHTDITEKKDH